jgi:GNAT superfamily N-acetyltransferase
VDTWRSIYASLIPDRVLIRMNPQRQARFWDSQIARGANRSVLVAECDGEVVGFVGVGRNRGTPIDFDGEVQTLYVLDDYQGQGIGWRLLEAGFRALLERGMNSVVVWVLAGNPSRFFYEAMGGQRIAEQTETLWGTNLPQIAYGWPDLREYLS